MNLIQKIILFLCCFFAGLHNLLAQTEAGSTNNNNLYIPSSLQPWVEWIKQKNPNWDCAYNNSTYICVWPGKITYSLQEQGAEFKLEVQTLVEAFVQLPSLAGIYPRNISIINKNSEAISAPFELNENLLQVKLPKGEYTIKGSFSWDKSPSELPLPGSYASVEVANNKDTDNYSIVRGSNYLRLEKSGKSDSSDSIALTVMRKITDGSPLYLETLIRLQVAGRSRPLEIPNLLVKGSEAISIQSNLPARLNQQGNLILQLLPGSHEIRILSVMQQPVSKIESPVVSLEAWPKEEIWTWWSDMQLRTVEISGAEPIDSQVTQLPQEWLGSAAYIIKSGQAINLTEQRRGQEMSMPNNVNLNRSIWLDLDGKGATILDNLQGSLYQANRLNIDDSIQIGRAKSDGDSALITLDPKTQSKGIEVRSNNLNFEVVAKIADAKNMLASGWDQPIENYSLTLNIPPAWRLLHVSGATHAQNAWVDKWTLLNIFLGVLLVLALYKLFGISTALLIGASLIINHNEFLAPNMLYVHITVLAALGKILKSFSDIWHSVCRALLYATFGLFLIQSLAFAKLQIIESIFPQLQSGTRHRTLTQKFLLEIENNLFVWPLVLLLIAYLAFCLKKTAQAKSVSGAIGRIIVSILGLCLIVPALGIISDGLNFRTQTYSSYPGSIEAAQVYNDESYESELSLGSGRMSKSQARSKVTAPQKQNESDSFSYQSKANIAGPALPEWRWKSSSIYVATPLDPNHQLRFHLLEPGISKFLCALRAILMLILTFILFSKLGLKISKPTLNISTAAILFACIAFYPTQANAQFPSQELLSELQNKLAATLCQQNNCSSIDTLNISINSSEMIISADVNSAGTSFVSLPGPLDRFDLKSVTVNSQSTNLLRRNEAGFLDVLTKDGKNIIKINTKLADVENFNIQFPQRALAVSVNSPDWYVEGLDSKGLVRDSLRFIKQSKEQAQSKLLTETDLATWIKVTRSFKFSDKINTNILIERIGSTDREAKASFLLLENEKLISQNVHSDKDKIHLNFEPNQKYIQLNSVLPFKSEFTLTANNLGRVAEEWQIQCDTFLACEYSGIKPISTSLNEQKVHSFLPFPTEQVKISVLNLSSPKGDFYTIDKTLHEIKWGSNLLEASLTANLRVTQQSNFWIKLPENSKLLDSTINGQSGQTSNIDNKVNFVLNPGEHKLSATYSMAWQASNKELAPKIELSSPANNTSIIIRPSADRWILWLSGDGWGPAVVFWTKLLVTAVICFALSHFGLIFNLSKLGLILLAIGLATLPVWAISIPLSWLVAINYLPKLVGKLHSCPRWLGQSAFAFLVLISIALWFSVIKSGLLFAPPMLIAGNNSNTSLLKWYVDHSSNLLPSSTVISVPIWYYRLFALLWSAWLSIALFRWLKDSIEIFKLPLYSKQETTFAEQK